MVGCGVQLSLLANKTHLVDCKKKFEHAGGGMHHPPSGSATVAECLADGWLAKISADLRGSGDALEACSRRCAIQMAAFTLLLLRVSVSE